jgi:hypothetical protein
MKTFGRVLVMSLAVSACSARAPRTVDEPGRDLDPDVATRELTTLRKALTSDEPRTFRVSAQIREGRTGQTLEARGALAVMPPEALRLQLVGPAGVLALDVWVKGARSRFAVPALGRIERSERGDDGDGRPVGFLRWWFLHPLGGTLVRARSLADGARFELRADDGAEVRATSKDGGRTLIVVRKTSGDVETVTSIATDGACRDATYESAKSRVGVSVRCEGEGPLPNVRAFEEPRDD